ncbi:hypothetical protein HZU77_016390 [Neisseriaceae bacterium TC5R-5]|nr:hypothetical protein [Neisseriaceae bacterium TC5R-5]
MTNTQNIEKVLTRMVELLRFGSRDDWANALENCCKEVRYNPNDTAAKILSMYGGMGSLNDIVLYKNSQPLIAENTEFDILRSDLYQICHAIS